MPHHFNCCVPGCTNSFRNSPELQFYRIPKDERLRKTYKIILKNETLRLDSRVTRICSSHFEGGTKLSRSHLPTIFPWTKQPSQRRVLKRLSPQKKNTQVKKQRKAPSCTNPSHDNLQQQPTIEEACDQNGPQAVSTQTDLTVEELCLITDREKNLQTQVKNLQTEVNELKCALLNLNKEHEMVKEDNAKLKLKVSQLQSKINKPRFDIEKYKDNPEDIIFYTGLPDYDALMLVYNIVKDSAKNINYDTDKTSVVVEGQRKIGRPRVLSTFEEFILTLMRIRLGLFEKDLSHRFSVAPMTVSRVTKAWCRFLRCEFEPLIRIPTAKEINLYMPAVFKHFYPNLTVIVDCTEIELEKPSSLDAQSACYSSYKSKTTAKALLGITPSGALCFVSQFFPGSISDKEITMQSGFLNNLRPGDQVMADKGFNCQDELASVGASLVTPAFLKGSHQFSKSDTEYNKKVASLRIHVERLMERIKNWHIFDHRIPVVLSPIASDILIVVCALSNFHPPLIN